MLIHFVDQLEYKSIKEKIKIFLLFLPISFSSCFSRKRALSTVNSIIFFIWKKFNAAAAVGNADVDDVDEDDDGGGSFVGEDVSKAVVERSIGFINRSNW